MASGPETPREAVQAFIDAGNAEDSGASWDMLCRRDQLTLGPRPHYLQERAAAAEETAALRAGTQVTVGDVQYDGTVPGYAVDLLIAPGDGSPPVQMVVVEEEGRPAMVPMKSGSSSTSSRSPRASSASRRAG